MVAPGDSINGRDLRGLRNMHPEYFEVGAYISEDPTSFSIAEPLEGHAELVWSSEPSDTIWPPEDPNAQPQYEPRYPELLKLVLPGLEISTRKKIDLPIDAYENEIISGAKENSLVFIDGPMGSGKSTRLGPMLYRSGLFDTVIHTFPRRVAAYGGYLRIKEELGIDYGDNFAESLTSYRTAGNHEGPKDAFLKIFTDGLFAASYIKRMAEVKDLGRMGVIIDESQEANLNQIALEAFLKLLVPDHPDLTVFIASGTLDLLTHTRFWSDVLPGWPPHVKIKTRGYPLERIERPESDVVKETLLETEKLFDTSTKVSVEVPPAGLIFQDGVKNIYDTIDLVLRRMSPAMRRELLALPLYASLTQNEQQAAIRPWPGKRVKLVFATNVAESSITVAGVRFVIDPGTVKVDILDKYGAEGLVRTVISRAECDQRAGRAGRTGPGVAILTRQDETAPYVPYINRRPFPIPEIYRKDLARTALRFEAVGLPFRTLELPYDVEPEKKDRACTVLQNLGALSAKDEITGIGERMNEFPVKPSLARMLHEAERYSENTRRYVAAIASIIEPGGLTRFDPDVPRRWKELTQETKSDHLAQLDIFIGIQNMDDKELAEYGINTNNLTKIRELYPKLLRRTNTPITELKEPSQTEREDIRRCVLAGLINTIYISDGNGTYIHISDEDEIRELSNRSLVTGHPGHVTATPYRVEVERDGEITIKHVLENVTVITPSDIEAVAGDKAEWRPEEFVMRHGSYVQKSRLFYADTDLGRTKEGPPEPSPQLRKIIIDHVLDHAGSQLQTLRGIKRELESIADHAKDHVPQLTHDRLRELVFEATPEDITDPRIVDARLRVLAATQNITLDSFVSLDQRKYIRDNAPETITVGQVTLALTYKKGVPIVMHIRKDDVRRLPDSAIQLVDGREIKFMYRNADNRSKRVGIHELKEKLGVTGVQQEV